jgi:hypothetical protein
LVDIVYDSIWGEEENQMAEMAEMF